MNTFFIYYYTAIIYSLEILAAITGVFVYKKFKNTAVIYFIHVLIYSFFIDLLGGYTMLINANGFLSFLRNTRFEQNYWWYTLMWNLGATSFYVYYFLKILKSNSFKKALIGLWAIFILSSIFIISFNFDTFFTSNLSLINNFSAILILLSCMFYFVEKLYGNNIFYFYKSINFYISITLLFWWLIMTPLVFFDNYNTRSDWNYVFLRRQIYMMSNIFMYLTFTFSLLWCKPQNV
ncbi:hypothetical protein PW52_13595 [Tamlana sedimentorum]|uniref:Uncharacterized protein n=1 Tax=Neotamlana sedimentorum TaxID=1435349 RepID=A0A0D7W8S6_9FLAO|nr:hypothetical protein PW52_13595 [Tamlana sedimentorum]